MAEKLIDEIIQKTIEFQDDQGNTVILDEDIIRKAFAPPDITEQEWRVYRSIVQKQRLDPTLYEVYCGKVNGKMTIFTGYRTYWKRVLAAKILKSHPKITVEKPDAKNKDTWIAKVVIQRNDMEGEFEYELPYIEAGYMLTKEGRKQKGGMWNIQAEFQFKKMAGVQAFRFILADVVGGMPYAEEEIEQDSQTTINAGKNVNGKKTEPDPEQLKKQKVIEGVFKAIDACDTQAELDDWVSKNSVKILQSPNKNIYNDHIKLREFQLAIILIAEKTGLEPSSIQPWYTEIDHSQNKALDALLGGDDDAIIQIKGEITDYIKSLEAELEAEVESAEPVEAELEM